MEQPPPPRKTFVIADIHGHAALLDRLLERLPIDWAADELVFLGDYVDRGPASRQVLEHVMALQARSPRVTALCGNHRSRTPARQVPHLEAARFWMGVVSTFCRVHATLQGTPAMAADLTDHIWSIRELLYYRVRRE